MISATSFPLSGAKEAQNENRLLEWVLSYLRSEANNEALAKRFKSSKPIYFTLQEIPLSRFKRIIGPEQGILFPESAEVFEERVGSLQSDLKEGAEFPPLIVTDFWTLGDLQDGAHRHEALLREGFITYHAIVCFEKEESLKFLD